MALSRAVSLSKCFFCGGVPESEIYQMVILLIVLSTVVAALIIDILNLWPR